MLVLHILAAGAWIGIDVLVAVLVTVGWFSDDNSLRVPAYRALASFVFWPMLFASVLCLLTGLGLGLGSRWGLLRFRWVAAKLFINILLAVLILFALRPTLGDVATYSDTVAEGRETSSRAISSLFYPPLVSLALLSFATALAVFKPGGQLRRRRTPPTADYLARPTRRTEHDLSPTATRRGDLPSGWS